MAVEQPTLAELARSRDLRTLEDRCLEAIEAGVPDAADLIEALAVLKKDGRAEEATTLGWAWITAERERSDARGVLDVARRILLSCGATDDMRREVIQLYREVHADRPETEVLLDASGLAGDKSVLRALRTLDICLGLTLGSYLVSRSDERAAVVTAIDVDLCMYTVRTPTGQETLDADALALAYDPVDENDFRVLLQFKADQIVNLLESDPVAIVIGLLKGHGGRLDADELEHLLSPRFIPARNWGKWWTKARNELRRSNNVVVESRNPVMLTYHAEGRTLEDEIGPEWDKAETPTQRLAVVDAYFREARLRKAEPDVGMVRRFHRDLLARVNAARAGAPEVAFREALIVDRLAENATLPEGEIPAREILAECPDPLGMVNQLGEVRLFLRALEHLRHVRPDEWPDLYARLLPRSPIEGCEAIAKTLAESGHRDLLARAIADIPSDFTRHIDALCWIWRGPQQEGLETLSPRELLPRLLEHLAELGRSDHVPADVVRDTRLKVRAALSADNYRQYRRVIQEMDASMASTIRRSIDRLDGLGQVVRSNLLNIVLDSHPALIARKVEVDVWLDENVILATREGMSRREEELRHLTDVKMKENAKAIGEAASHGDLSENSEYRFALEERDLLRARVARIQEEMSIVRLLAASDVSTDRVNIGTRVILESVDGAIRRDFTVLGPWEADIEKGIYNYRAPLCAKLKGLCIGDTVKLDLDGTEREYRVGAITNAVAG